MGSGPWPTLLIFFGVNLLQNLFTGGTISVLSMVELGVMIVSLVAYVGLIGSGGSDVFGVGSTVAAVARAVAITAFIASIVAVVVGGYLQFANPIIAFLNLAIGGFAVFQAISAAKPGAA